MLQEAAATVQDAPLKCADTDAPLLQEELRTGKPEAPATLQLLPIKQTKVIYFVRHGQGFHNVAGHLDPANYRSDEYEDAHLTPLGWRQAEGLKAHVSERPEISPDIVVVSPLTRTIETAIGAFGGGEWRQGDGATPLMLEQAAISGKVAARKAVTTAGCPPFVAWEGCREHMGVHPCDRRRSTNYYRGVYPGIDFSMVEDGPDRLWRADEREGRAHIKARGLAFVEWLRHRPERRIAVVSHSSFLFFLFRNFGLHCSDDVKGGMQRWFDNGEMRAVVLTDAQDERPKDPLWFPSFKGEGDGAPSS